MKKLLIIPAVLLLASCGSNGGATGLSTSAPASTGQSTSKTTPAGPTITDITLNVTVSGIDTYEEDHQYIWISCDFLGESSTEWGATKLTQDTTDSNKWSVVLKDFELEQSLSYDFYYGTETSPDWVYGRNVTDSEYTILITEEGKTSYDVTASFHIPVVTGQINLRWYVDAKVKESATAEEVALADYNHVWAYNSLDGNNVKLEKQIDGRWLFAKDNVDLLDGVANVQLTLTLGRKYTPNWDYKSGSYEGSSWVEDARGLWHEFKADEAEYSCKALFKGQPADVASKTVTINYVESSETTHWANSRWLEASYVKNFNGALNDFWPGNLDWNSEINGYSNTYEYEEDFFYFTIGLWYSDTTPKAFVGASLEKAFKVTLTDSVASLTITATITDTGSDPILIVGAASDCTGCTVE